MAPIDYELVTALKNILARKKKPCQLQKLAGMNNSQYFNIVSVVITNKKLYLHKYNYDLFNLDKTKVISVQIIH